MSPQQARVEAAFKSLRLVLDRELPNNTDRLRTIERVNDSHRTAVRSLTLTARPDTQQTIF